MIKDVERGIYIVGDGSFSIDQQRYNFQFGGQLFYEIEKGEIKGMLRDVAYQSNTQEFWNSCVAVCDKSDYSLGGSFFDGKGQPSQVSAVSHGSATTPLRQGQRHQHRAEDWLTANEKFLWHNSPNLKRRRSCTKVLGYSKADEVRSDVDRRQVGQPALRAQRRLDERRARGQQSRSAIELREEDRHRDDQ